MRAAVILAMLPMAMWATWPAPPPPIVAKVVQTEGVREQRMDAGTFAQRWRVVSQLPPALEIHEVTVQSIGEGAGNSGTRPAGVERAKTGIAGRTVPSPMLRKRASLAPDICQRHRMHKVWVTAKRWRCHR